MDGGAEYWAFNIVIPFRDMDFFTVQSYDWRTRHDSNVRPSVPQTVLAGIKGQTATNKGNYISSFIDLNCYKISSYMACFCKLMAQNWHKILPHTDHKNGVTELH